MPSIQRRAWQWCVGLTVVCLLVTSVPARADEAVPGRRMQSVQESERSAPSCESRAEARARRKAKRQARKEARRKAREAREERRKARGGEARALAQQESNAGDDVLAPVEKTPEPDWPSARTPVRTEPEEEPVAEAEETPEVEETSVRDASAATLTAQLAAFSGVMWRSIDLPTVRGQAALHMDMLPSVGLQLGLHWPGDPRYALTLNYQSSFGAEATQASNDPQRPAFTTSIHAHHFDAGFVAALSLGDSPDSTSLGLLLGYGVRALGSVAELGVPRYSLHGPLVRLELELPLGTPSLVLRLAPEAQLIVSISDDLTLAGGFYAPIFGFGGEAGLRIRFSRSVALQLAFREAHVVVATPYGASFEDVERFGLLGLVVTYY